MRKKTWIGVTTAALVLAAGGLAGTAYADEEGTYPPLPAPYTPCPTDLPRPNFLTRNLVGDSERPDIEGSNEYKLQSYVTVQRTLFSNRWRVTAIQTCATNPGITMLVTTAMVLDPIALEVLANGGSVEEITWPENLAPLIKDPAGIYQRAVSDALAKL